MARWYSVESAEEGIFTSAPYVFRYSKIFAAPPETVWESLVSDESLSAWSATVKSLTWSSPRPFGIGTTREVVLAPGLARVHERFIRWDEGRGYAFTVYEASVPALKHFAEDYVLTPEGQDATRFDWTVAIEPTKVFALPFVALAPVLKLAFGRMAADGQRFFARTG